MSKIVQLKDSNNETVLPVSNEKAIYDDSGTRLDVKLSNITPSIGENGNWYINGQDTNKPSKGADGVSLGEIALEQELSTAEGSENKVVSQKVVSEEYENIKKSSGLNVLTPIDSKLGFIDYNSGNLSEDAVAQNRFVDYYTVTPQQLLIVYVGRALGSGSATLAFYKDDEYILTLSKRGDNGLDKKYIVFIPTGVNKIAISHNSQGSNIVSQSVSFDFSDYDMIFNSLKCNIPNITSLPTTLDTTNVANSIGQLQAYNFMNGLPSVAISTREGYIQLSNGSFIAGTSRSCDEYDVLAGEKYNIYVESTLASAGATVSFFNGTTYLGSSYSIAGNAGVTNAEIVVPNGATKMYVSYTANKKSFVTKVINFRPFDITGKVDYSGLVSQRSFGVNRLIVPDSSLRQYKDAVKELYIDLSNSQVTSDDGKYYLCRFRNTDRVQIAVGTLVGGTMKILVNYYDTLLATNKREVLTLSEYENSGVVGYAIVDVSLIAGVNARPDEWAELDKSCFSLMSNPFLKDWLEYNSDKPLQSLRYDGGMTAILHSLCAIGGSLASGEHEYHTDGTLNYVDLYEYSWVQRIAKLCGNKGVNLSKGGMTCLSWLSGEFYTQAAEENNKCVAYIIMLGNNDTNASYPLGSIADVQVGNESSNGETFYGYYSRVIARIKEVQPRAYIFPMTIQRGWGNDETMQQYNNAIREIATLYDNTFLIDYYKYGVSWSSSEDFWTNNARGGHLVASGYQYMAYELCTYIDWIIRNNPEPFKDAAFVGTEYNY